MRITGDDNLLEAVETGSLGSTLNVSQDDAVKPDIGLRVDVSVPELEEVEVNGAGDVRIAGLRGESLALESAGSVDIRARGSVEELSAEVSGSGDMLLGGPVAETAEVEGSGTADVTVTRELDASVSGAGNLTYAGNPIEVRRDLSGSGEITPR